MSDKGFTNRIERPLRTVVYTRRVSDGGVPTDGESVGWMLDTNLRCDELVLRRGAKPGSTKIAYIPIDAADVPFEESLKPYSVDDQVRVEVFPIEDELSESPGNPRVVFEGVLVRHLFNAVADAQTNAEVVGFIALPFPWLDNAGSGHLVTGRWVVDVIDSDEDGNLDPFIVETPSVPPVFNFQGQRNRHASAIITADGADGGSGGGLTAPVFTHDDDPTGVFWTVGEALASILVMWLYGAAPFPQSRHIDLEPQTAAALMQAPGGEREDRFIGLDSVLPEVNVLGRGVLDAFAAVCSAGGFEFAVEPSGCVPDSDTGDRMYTLRLWRRNTGTVMHLDLDKRGTTYSSAEATLSRNNISKINGMRDGAEIVNEVFAIGPAFMEATFELRPLWNPDDVSGASIATGLQAASEEQLQGTGYHARHVVNGALFDQYGHVGRVWGIDCVGGFAGYTSGIYQHPSGGFDFVGEFGIDGSTFDLEREFQGLTAPIRWTRRVRQALPLAAKEAQDTGVEYLLEVSEDGGTTWDWCFIKIQTLSRYLGVTIHAENLAAVNNATLGTGLVPAPDKSWWALIQQEQLQFRLSCTIEADHALRYDALRQSTSGSRYPRGQVLASRASAISQHRSSPYSNGAFDFFPIGTELQHFRAIAERRRDSTEDSRVSVSAGTWVMDIDRYRLGDRIASVRGRGYSLAANSGEAQSYPNIAAIKYRLGVGNQFMRLSLADERLTGGA